MLKVLAALPFTFAAPLAAWAGGACFVATVAIVLLRRSAIGNGARVLCAGGLALLCLAAGGPIWRRPAARDVAVVVDLSPSTRSAEYRSRPQLLARIRQLLGETPYRLLCFADGEAQPFAHPDADRFPDLPAERTRYIPPAAAAIVLLTDGRFDLAAAIAGPPTYPVIDIGLAAPSDAAIADLSTRGPDALIEIRNSGKPRPLAVGGLVGNVPTTAPSGDSVITRARDTSAASVFARLSPGDLWPENDMLSALPVPPERAERWLVSARGRADLPDGWRVIAPAALPTDAAAYLTPGVIVLDDIPAASLSELQQDRLRQFARDLGGGIVLIGGSHAFAAGGYPGTGLDALSPLASAPPEPATNWLVLADGSGSMGAAAAHGDGRSQWQFACDAVAAAIRHLPPDDLASVGSFAETLAWWAQKLPVHQARNLRLPPANVFPSGPTNLRPALEQIAAESTGATPKELLLLTDADAEVGDPATLIPALKQGHIRLHLLALGNGRGLAALQLVVAATGGRSLREDDAAKWAAASESLLRDAAPTRLESTPLPIRYLGEFATLAGRPVTPWDRTWLKPGATILGEGALPGGDGAVHPTLAAVAQWNVGEGQVLAAGFEASPAEVERFAAAVARPPRDPRFRVTWQTGPSLRVSVDAVAPDASGNGAFLNSETLTLDMSPATLSDASHPETSSTGRLRLTLTAPGHYEAAIPAPREAAVATVRAGASAIDRIALPGRYAPEFDAIGDDDATLDRIARQTGGRVIPPADMTPIQFNWPPRDIDLTSILAAIGALLFASGLLWWRWR